MQYGLPLFGIVGNKLDRYIYIYTIRISRYEFDMLFSSTVEWNLLYVRVLSDQVINPLSYHNTEQYVVYAAELKITVAGI